MTKSSLSHETEIDVNIFAHGWNKNIIKAIFHSQRQRDPRVKTVSFTGASSKCSDIQQRPDAIMSHRNVTQILNVVTLWGWEKYSYAHRR